MSLPLPAQTGGGEEGGLQVTEATGGATGEEELQELRAGLQPFCTTWPGASTKNLATDRKRCWKYPVPLACLD